MKLIDMLLDTRPDCKIYQEESIFSPKELLHKVEKMIGFLKSVGVRKKDKLIVCMEHNIDGISFLAAASALGVQLILNYNLETQTEQEIMVAVSQISYDYIVFLKKDEKKASFLKGQSLRLIEIWKYEDVKLVEKQNLVLEPVPQFLVLFTSGSSGKPKAISISEETICERIRLVSKKLEFDETSVVFMSGLLSNTTGIIFSFGAFLNNSDLIIPRNRNVIEWVGILNKFEATHIMLRPALMETFINTIDTKNLKLPSIKVIAYGAASMPENSIDLGRARLNCKWIQGYGLSETFGPFIWLDESAHKKGRYKEEKYCIGIPDDSLQIRINPSREKEEVGELEVLGKTMMNGYLDVAKNVLLPCDGWFKTGDLVKLGSHNQIYIKGRISNTILSKNGHCIYPEEIEAVIGKIGKIQEYVLVASWNEINQEFNGSILCVYTKELTQDDLIKVIEDTLRKQVSKEKWPDWLYRSETAFLKGQNDKILKQQVCDGINLAMLRKICEE